MRLRYKLEFKKIYQVLIIFFFIYDVQPIGVPSFLTSRKIVFLFLVIRYLFKNSFEIRKVGNRIIQKTIQHILIVSVIIMCYTILIISLNSLNGSFNGTSIFPRSVYFIIFTAITWRVMYEQFDDVEQFSLACTIASTIQALIVILEFFVSAFSLFLSNHFLLDAHIQYGSTVRAAGLGAGDSLLSIDLFLGTISCAYMILKRKRYFKYLIIYGLLTISSFLSGSTGFLLCSVLLVCLLIYLFIYKRGKKVFSIILFCSTATLGVIIIYPEFFENILQSQIFIKINSLFSDGLLNNMTMRDLRTQAVAPISIDTIVGTGIYRGISAGGMINTSDTGYLQTYFGYGLIMTIVFYFTLYKNMFKNLKLVNDKDTKFLLIYLFCSIAVSEAKEPYIFHYGNLLVFFMFCFMNHKQEYSFSRLPS